MKNGQPNLYAALNLPRDATPEEIRRAYHEAAQKLHPDKNQAPGETEMFLEVQQAYEVLSNPTRRAQYDATLPPEEEIPSLVLHEVYFSRPNLVWLTEPQMIYLLLQISPRTNRDEIAAPPLNLSLVLDRSTSMQGEKMDVVKSAAAQLLRGMRDGDILSVITFSDRAEVVIPATSYGDRRKMESNIHKMQPSGSTEIFQGLEAGMREVQRNFDRRRVNHIILLTDGQTYGDEQACLNLAAEAAVQNIGITGMGIGADWNDIFLDALASRTGGSSAYISKPGDIERILVEKFRSLANTFADEVLMEMIPTEGIDLKYAFRMQPEPGPLSIGETMKLGTILQDEPLCVLFEFVVQPSALQGSSVVLMNSLVKIAVTSHPHGTAPIRLRLVREVQTEATDEPPPTKILSALSQLTLYRMQERAHEEAQAGRYDEASRALKDLATNLLSQGEHGLAHTALLEADYLGRMHEWSADGGKEIKYSTRALLSSTKGIKT